MDCYRSKTRADDAEERAKDAENEVWKARAEAARQAGQLQQEAADERTIEGELQPNVEWQVRYFACR